MCEKAAECMFKGMCGGMIHPMCKVIINQKGCTAHGFARPCCDCVKVCDDYKKIKEAYK